MTAGESRFTAGEPFFRSRRAAGCGAQSMRSQSCQRVISCCASPERRTPEDAAAAVETRRGIEPHQSEAALMCEPHTQTPVSSSTPAEARGEPDGVSCP